MRSPRPPRHETSLNALVCVATVLLIATVAWRVQRESTSHASVVVDIEYLSEWRSYSEAGQRIGDPAARVTVVEFLDFACSVCERAADYMTTLEARLDTITIVYRHYPQLSLASRKAALAMECAAQQGRLRPFYRAAFANRRSLGDVTPTGMAEWAGVEDASEFRRCLDSESVAQRLTSDTLAARQLGVSGVPTFLINGRKVTGFYGANVMDSLIAVAASESRRAGSPGYRGDGTSGGLSKRSVDDQPYRR